MRKEGRREEGGRRREGENNNLTYFLGLKNHLIENI